MKSNVKRLSVWSSAVMLLPLCVSAQQAPMVHIRGIITDSKTHLPVAGVTVSAVQAKHDARTDTQGYFNLELHGVNPGADVLIHIEKGGYRADDLTEAASDNVVYQIQIFSAATAPKTKSEGPHDKTVQAIKSPLEVVAFDSSNDITIANNGPLSVYMVSLVLKSEQDSRSYELGFDIEPGKFYKHPFPPPSASEGAMLAIDGKEHFRVIMPLAKLADTWNEHLRKAVGLFQKCGMMLIYFSPSDSAFLTMKDAYSWKPERPLLNLLGLGYGDASGTLYYRVKGFTETKEQSVPLVVIVAIDGDRCPHAVAVPFAPNQSHP